MVLMEAVKNELHWGEDISIPTSNAENKKLEEEIQNRISDVAALKAQLDTQNEHIAAVTNYLTSIQETLKETQGLCQSKKQEIEHEKHLQALLVNEERCLAQEIGHFQKDLDSLLEKKSKHTNVIQSLEEKLETLKEDIHWDQKALDSWLQEAIQKDDDANLLATFMNEDASKIRELNNQLTKLAVDEQQQKKLLDKTAVELKITQMDLDKTSEEFKERHKERQNFFNQWQTTAQQMQKRDMEIESLIEEISQMKEQIDKTKQQCKEQTVCLEKRSKENRDTERNVGAKERLQSKLQQQLTKADEEQKDMQREVDILKQKIVHCKEEQQSVKWKTGQLDILKKEQEARLQRENDEREELVWQVHHASETAMTAEDMFRQLESSAVQERLAINQLQKETIKLQELHSEELKHVDLLTNKHKLVSAEIEGLKKIRLKCDATMQQLDCEAKAQELIQASKEEEFALLMEQYKAMKGNESILGKVNENQGKVKLLTQMLDAKKADCQVLTQETKQQQDELRLAHKDLEHCMKQKVEFNAQLGAITLHNDVAKKTLKDIHAKKQQLLVDQNILKLEVRRLREIITNKSTNVLSLEKHRLHLEATIQKRHEETDIEEQTLKTEIRLIEEGRQRLANELNNCVLRTTKLKKRCEIMSFPLKSWKWDEEEIAPVHFLMKAAEDKDTLKREHAEMQNKLQSAERDLQAFETNAQLLATKTATMRIAINSTNESNELAEEKSLLEEQLQSVATTLDSRKKQLHSMTANLKKRRLVLDQLTEKEMENQMSMNNKQNQLDALNEEMQEMDAKLVRANRQLSSLCKQLDKSPSFAFNKQDAKLRLIKENNKRVVAELNDLMTRYPEITATAMIYFEKANLPWPSKTGASRSQSVASSSSLASLPSLTSYSRGSTPSLGGIPQRSDRKTPPSTASSTVSLPSVVNLTFDDTQPKVYTKRKSTKKQIK